LLAVNLYDDKRPLSETATDVIDERTLIFTTATAIAAGILF